MERRWGSWGILIFTVWSLVLTLLAAAKVLLLSKAVDLETNMYGTQTAAWFILVSNVMLGIGFAASTYGLWRRRDWGRLLFMGMILIWFGANLAMMFMPGAAVRPSDQGIDPRLINGLRFAVGLILSLIYLNLPRVKALFNGHTTEDINHD